MILWKPYIEKYIEKNVYMLINIRAYFLLKHTHNLKSSLFFVYIIVKFILWNNPTCLVREFEHIHVHLRQVSAFDSSLFCHLCLISIVARATITLSLAFCHLHQLPGYQPLLLFSSSSASICRTVLGLHR